MNATPSRTFFRGRNSCKRRRTTMTSGEKNVIYSSKTTSSFFFFHPVGGSNGAKDHKNNDQNRIARVGMDYKTAIIFSIVFSRVVVLCYVVRKTRRSHTCQKKNRMIMRTTTTMTTTTKTHIKLIVL